MVEQKQQIREKVKRKKEVLSQDLFRRSSKVIQHLAALPIFPTRQGQALIYFVGKPQTCEVQTLPHIRNLITRGLSVWLPKTVVANKSLRWGNVLDVKKDLVLGKFSVPEPIEDVISRESIDFTQIEIAIVPGVAFDEYGHRIGYGQGYYDRFLANASLTCPVVGLAFEFQVFPQIPTEAHDSIVDIIVTDTRVRKINPGETKKEHET